MKKILSLILASVMLLSCMGILSSCGEEDGSFVIGITYFKPMNYLDDNGNLIGFETEFATAVCEKLGYTPEFKKIEWNSKESELNSKNIDCIWNGMTIDNDRKAAFAITAPYMNNKQVLVVKRENLDKFSDAENLKGAVIVVENGSAGEKVVTTDELFAESKYTEIGTQSATLREVDSGSADGAVLDYICAVGMIGDGTSFENLAVVTGYEFKKEDIGVAFRKTDPDIRDKFEEAINELIADGTVEAIARKYKLEGQLIKK